MVNRSSEGEKLLTFAIVRIFNYPFSRRIEGLSVRRVIFNLLKKKFSSFQINANEKNLIPTNWQVYKGYFRHIHKGFHW